MFYTKEDINAEYIIFLFFKEQMAHKKQSEWNRHVTATYRKHKKTNSKYTLGMAMRDAKKTYKKKGS